MVVEDPRSEYLRRLEARRAEHDRQERRHRTLGNLRLITVAAAAAMLWFRLPGVTLALPAAVFVILLIVHERVLRRLAHAKRAVAFYERCLNRLDGRWRGEGETGERFLDSSHPFAEDLDLFGRGSLFELISTARTRAGEETLARWLMTPAPVSEIRSRQAAIEELRNRIDLREDLALLGEDIRTGVNASALAAWGQQPPVLNHPWARLAAPILVVLLAVTLAGWLWMEWPLLPALLVGSAMVAFSLHFKQRAMQVIHALEQPGHDLSLLAAVLVRLEREEFTTPRLTALRAELETAGSPPSRQIARLSRLVELVDSRDHLLLRFVGPLLLWTTQLAFAVEAWRKRSGPSVERWLATVGEMEALTALAGYAFEHPADPFPEFVDEGPYFEGVELGHPLLPEDRAVRNDLRLDRNLRLLVVSGSNMSGKTTMLRTVGVNLVLAQAGAPVRARQLRLSPLSLGASIRVHDSLEQGLSRFYTEVLRLRQLVEIAAGAPLLFLLDEILHGTNSHDRRIGAAAVLRTLVRRGAIGLVTTHDLALTEIAHDPAVHAANVHFQDEFVEGRIVFDYKMRPGVVTKSNALELMRSVGLDVSEVA